MTASQTKRRPSTCGDFRQKQPVLQALKRRAFAGFLKFVTQSYYEPDEVAIDRVIHVLGLVGGGFGIISLIGTALYRLEPAGWWSIVLYTACLSTMLVCSAAYNLTRHSSRRDLLRRLDHAAIFLMIAGTYTPFTTRALPSGWAIAMTSLVWALALAGAFMELRYPRRLQRVDLALYLTLGWIILIAWEPLLASIDTVTAMLIIVGGVLYTVGSGFHVWRGLRFQNAIWHGFVLVAAGCHYAAVLRIMH